MSSYECEIHIGLFVVYFCELCPISGALPALGRLTAGPGEASNVIAACVISVLLLPGKQHPLGGYCVM